MNATAGNRPVIALAMGDPTGTSPELTAKVVALDEVRTAVALVVIGDKRVFDEGAKVAGVSVDFTVIGPGDPIPPAGTRPVFVDLKHLDPAWIADGNNITDAFVQYAKPLIGTLPVVGTFDELSRK